MSTTAETLLKRRIEMLEQVIANHERIIAMMVLEMEKLESEANAWAFNLGLQEASK